MSQEDIDRLVAERSLARAEFDDDDVATFWAKAAASHTDARFRGISIDSAFQLAYTTALQATFAVLAAHGLRVKSTANHYNAFFALQKLEDGLRPHAILFDGLRTTRHASVCEATADEVRMAAQLDHAFKVLPPGLSAIRASIISARPTLTTRLAQIS
jgi:hypothetical protein